MVSARNTPAGSAAFAAPTPQTAKSSAHATAARDNSRLSTRSDSAIRRREVVAEQLQVALNSRVIIEQAKGVLAERGQLDMDRAFQLIRGYARSTNQLLSVVALSIVDGTTTAEALARPLHGSTSP